MISTFTIIATKNDHPMKIKKLLFPVLFAATIFAFGPAKAQNVDLSISEVWPAIKGNVPNYDLQDLSKPYWGGYQYIPVHVFKGFNPVGLPVNHPGDESITFDWQLTLTADPAGAGTIVYDQTANFTLSTGEADTISFGQEVSYLEKTQYKLTALLTSANDDNNSNNQAEFHYTLSDSLYGYADKNNSSGSFTLVDTLNAGNQDGVGVVMYFPEPTEDPYQVNSMSTYLKDDYTGVIANGNATFVGVVYPRDENTGLWNLSGAIAQTNPKNLTIDDVNSEITMSLVNPLSISSETEYLFMLYIFNNDDATEEGRITIANDPDSYAPYDLRCVMDIDGSIEYAQATPAIWVNIEPQELPVNTEAEILSYSIANQVTSEIDANNQTISVTMPGGTDLTSLVADFVLSTGATATVDGAAQTSGTTANDFTSPVVYTVTAEDGTTTKNWTVTVNVELSDAAEILDYTIPNQVNSSIDEVSQTIDVTMPEGTDLTSLVADFVLSTGATATVDGAAQTSGTTANDFTDPVVYTVTAEDGTTTKNWTVNVQEAASNGTAIIDFNIPNQESSEINSTEETVDIVMPVGTDLTSLVPDFTLSPGATATVEGVEQVSGTTANDFTNPVIYTVTAEDGTTSADWTVTVTTNASGEAEILGYSIPDQINSTIDSEAQTIDVDVPLGTDLTNLVADFTLSQGATAIVNGTEQISGTTPNDFTSPVVYTITAQDGTTTKDWTVTVTTIASSEAEIISYSIPDQLSSEIDTDAQTVNVVMPMDTDLSSLIADFSLSVGATATVEGAVQESGVTVNDFTDAVVYIITAQDGTTTAEWTVNVTEQALSPADFISYNIDGEQGALDYDNAYIRVEMPAGTDLTSLVATFEVADGAVVTVGGETQESGVTVNDFTEIVAYRLNPANGASRTWYVDVAVDGEMNNAAMIEYFGFYGQTNPAEIDNQSNVISVNLAPNLNVEALIPMFYLSDGAIAYIGNEIQWSGQNIVDFSNPVTYTIVAENGTDVQDWTVEVTTNQNASAEILSYYFDGLPLSEQLTTIYNNSNSIYVDIPSGTPRDALVANYELSSGATASVNGVVQQSGITINDFSTPVSYVVTSQNGVNERTWTVNVRYVTGIDEQNNGAFMIYPNPVADVTKVRIPGQKSGVLMITDLSGQVQKTMKANTEVMEVNVTNMSAGVYLVIYRSGTTQLTQRMIVQ